MPSEIPAGREEHRVAKCPKDGACEACKLARFEGSKLRHAVIHNYSYRPRGNWKTRGVKDDPFDYFLGVELETDAHMLVPTTTALYGRSIREEFSTVATSIAADMRRPKHLWVPKMDSSVTGPEFASHPVTLTYWRKHRKQLDEMFRMLLHAGYRSHDNDNCGMHVNISRSAFGDTGHLFRFLTLLHANPAWALRMSQRSQASAQQWADMTRLTDIRSRGNAARLAMRSPGASNGLGKYTCLNAPAGQPRFEFRLPRGTLRIDRFFKNLEWTVAMIEYARTEVVKDCTPEQFMDYIRNRDFMYPDLAAFIAEKFKSKAVLANTKSVKAYVPEDESAIALNDASTPRVRPLVRYSDLQGAYVYAEDYNGQARGTVVRHRDTYTDIFGVERWVSTNYAV